jgi:hypothetical protein
MNWKEILKAPPLTPEEENEIQQLMRFRNMNREDAERTVRRRTGKTSQGKVSHEEYMRFRKGEGERHFYIENGKPVQWTGETHKHPDGTLMSGTEHKEGVSKKLLHLHELDEKHLKHLSKETTVIKWKESIEKGCGCAECEEEMKKKLFGNQKIIAAKAPPKDEITGEDFKTLRGEKKKLMKL